MMGDLFDINAIPGFQEAITAAMEVIHGDITKRDDVDLSRGLTIKLSVDPDSLYAIASIKTNLPKSLGFGETLGAVPLIRENGTLRVPTTEPPAPFFDK
jgi:hypothetical protein